jgi:hypothetical protein
MNKFSHVKIKYFLYVVFSILFLYSCSKEDEDEISIISQTEIIQYNLTVSNSTNGRVRVSQGTFYYDSQVVPVIKGQLVTVEAWADEGYRFESWSNGETDEIITLSINSDSSISANFVQIQLYELSVNNPEGGFIIVKKDNISVSPGEFYEGTELTISAVIEEGYLFESWQGIQSNLEEVTITLDSNLEITLELTPIPFDVNNMDLIKYHLYNKDTLSGKKVNDIKYERNIMNYLSHSFTEGDIQNNLDYLVSENFIVWWDSRFNKTEMAIDILRWSEYSVVKLLEYGFDKPKDFDTHRINVFVRHEGEQIDIIPDEGTSTAYVSTYKNGRKHISYPSRNYSIIREYPTPPVIHEMVHVFQQNTNKINFDYRWFTEATAEYIEQKLLLPVNGTSAGYQFADYLYSTNLLFWDDSSDTYHEYGLSLFFLYLDWIGLFSPSMVANSYRESGITTTNNWNIESAFEYIKRVIPDFEEVYFSFALKSATIDFNFRDKIINTLINQGTRLINGGFKKIELIIENDGTNGFYNPTNELYDWGFQTYMIKSTENQSYKFDLDSSFNNFKYGLVIEKGTDYQYYEIDAGSEFNLESDSNAYIIVFNVGENTEKRLRNNTYDLYDPYEYSIKISKL